MTDSIREELAHQRRLWRYITRTAFSVFVVVVVLALVTVNRKADRVACIDDIEVDWRIHIGQGVSHLIVGDDQALPGDAASLDITTELLQEVDSGERCRYESPWPG